MYVLPFRPNQQKFCAMHTQIRASVLDCCSPLQLSHTLSRSPSSAARARFTRGTVHLNPKSFISRRCAPLHLQKKPHANLPPGTITGTLGGTLILPQLVAQLPDHQPNPSVYLQNFTKQKTTNWHIPKVTPELGALCIPCVTFPRCCATLSQTTPPFPLPSSSKILYFSSLHPEPPWHTACIAFQRKVRSFSG
jgi:hypothetical protein